MSIKLYEHNQKAYDSALLLMNKTGKAAIIHPTGTGKSFIAFKLAEENSDKTICWLSPSEYIFNIQVENIKNTFGSVPQNIKFFTYAKVNLMSQIDIESINPAYIVLDEFHRCGAEQWGKGVRKITEYYNTTPILGLSATSIRYLDNNRDMADEIFESNVASEMTLGEAIVKNILSPPVYILSIYSFQKELEKYKERVKRTREKGVESLSEKYFDELKRSLENADGLEALFEKHITKKNSKFIVFCANFEHMQEMINMSYKWFERIDEQPHIFSMYSNDSVTKENLEDFRKDKSENLKLLFCIDMLNEGVHIDDIDGVILFRPTVSPIIYKQQIGRALSAGSKKNPIIFDIVNNFENLYSISNIQEEINQAVNFYRSTDSTKVINDKFEIIDEVRECKEIFDQLQKSLEFSWNTMYLEAKEYFETKGNLEVPKRYKTKSNLSLGQWIIIQKRVRSGKINGILTKEQIEKLDEIGMIWDNRLEVSWKNNYQHAKEYFEKYGNLDVKVNYKTEDGFLLGVWIANLRQNQKKGKLSDLQIQQLESIGMIWGKLDYLFQKNYMAAVNYFKKFGHIDLPSEYVDENGVAIGRWIHALKTQRKNGLTKRAELTDEQIELLNAIGMNWEPHNENKWTAMYEIAKEFYKTNGNLDMHSTYKTVNNIALGKWLYIQRSKKQKLTQSKIKKLEKIGMIWEDENSWDIRFNYSKNFFEEYGHLNIPSNYKTKDNIWLGKWLSEQKKAFLGQSKIKLNQSQVKKLESIGIIWDSKLNIAWENAYQKAYEYYNCYKNLEVNRNYITNSGFSLGLWIVRQRQKKAEGKLSNFQIEKLENIKMIWELPQSWEDYYFYAQEYYIRNGNLNVPIKYTTDNGLNLGNWILRQRTLYNGKSQYGKLSIEQIERLNSIGMEWVLPSEKSWKASYKYAKEYYNKNKNLNVKTTYIDENGFKIGEWLRSQQRAYKKGSLSKEKIDKLNKIAMNWKV